MTEEEQAIAEEAPEETSHTFQLTAFFHTGVPQTVDVEHGSTVADMRDALQAGGIRTHGSQVLLNGVPVPFDADGVTEIVPGDVVVFTGSVKGG